MKKTSQNILVLGAKSDIAAATARLYAEQSLNLPLAARETESLEKIKEDLLIRGAVNVDLIEVNLESVKSIKSFLKNLDPLPDLVL